MQDDYNAQYNGKTHAELIELFGPPDRTTSNGKGGEVLIYEAKSQQGGYSESSVSLTEFKKQTCFFVDENKVCYNVTTDDVKEERVYSKSLTIAGLLFCGFLGLFILVINAD
jgi:hypothetical protein